MFNLVAISSNDKLSTLKGIVNDVAPALISNFHRVMMAQHVCIWSNHCMDQTEESAAFMFDLLPGMLEINLPHQSPAIMDRYNQAITYQEIAQYNQLDSNEQFLQDDFWQRDESQSDFYDKLNMYLNEY